MDMQLDTLLGFVSFTHEIREVKRSMLVQGLDQYENDAEHSYQLAMVTLFIIEEAKLELDAYHAMALALVHDILEVHAGDTFIYGSTTDTQAAREKAAVEQLHKQWPEQTKLLGLIDEYEACQTAESKLVYALDKLVPVLNNILDDGRSWKREGISLDQVIAAKAKKITVDPTAKAYFDLAVDHLKAHPELYSRLKASKS